MKLNYFWYEPYSPSVRRHTAPRPRPCEITFPSNFKSANTFLIKAKLA